MALYTNSAFYPHYGVTHLRERSGSAWRDLVDFLSDLPRRDMRVIALSMMMRRLRKELDLDASLCSDPFFALDHNVVMTFFTGTEDDLLGMYNASLEEVRIAMNRVAAREAAASAVA